MQQQPQREHQWLQQLVGSWAYEAEALMGPEEPPLTFRGSEVVGSMMDFLWRYEGRVDASGRQLALDAEGPSFAGDGTMARYQDRIEFLSADHRTLSSGLIGPEGTWDRFMTAHYRRA